MRTTNIIGKPFLVFTGMAWWQVTGLILLLTGLFACASTPQVPFSTDPQAMEPMLAAGISDDRGRFREIFCSVLDERGESLPDYRPCDEALTLVGAEPPGSGEPVDLDTSEAGLLVGIVPGFGWDCFANWLDAPNSVSQHMAAQGFETSIIAIDGLSGTMVNAGLIRDAIVDLDARRSDSPVVLVGYSKGVPDILEFLVNYPGPAERVAAVVSIAGAINGSALAIGASQSQAEFLLHVPGSECEKGDRGAVQSMLPEVREQWMAEHTLPDDIPIYTVVTFPQPDRISRVLKRGYNKLAKIDGRNDSQLIYYDQVIPGSTLLAFSNADHWAMAVPVDRGHPFIGSIFVDQNDYPREAFLEAVLRYVEEDLAARKN